MKKEKFPEYGIDKCMERRKNISDCCVVVGVCEKKSLEKYEI